jgi:hypothetical protein
MQTGRRCQSAMAAATLNVSLVLSACGSAHSVAPPTASLMTETTSDLALRSTDR